MMKFDDRLHTIRNLNTNNYQPNMYSLHIEIHYEKRANPEDQD